VRQVLQRYEALTKKTPAKTARASKPVYPLKLRACCIQCRRPMGCRLNSKWPYWYCRPCKVPYCPLSKSTPFVSSRAREKRAPDTRGNLMPWCIIHRCRMHKAVSGWDCYCCEAQAKKNKALAKQNSKYPSEVRPCCIYCRESMVSNASTRRSPPSWRCSGCHTTTPKVWEPDKQHFRHSNIDLHDQRPCCIACRKLMSIGGTANHRRWACSQCGVTVLVHPAFVRKERAEPTKATPEYIAQLCMLNRLIVQTVSKNSGQPFNVVLSQFRLKVAFQITRNPVRDEKAVRRCIDHEMVTLEEIAEEVPLTVAEIKAICDRLVAASTKTSGYEWRPIGRGSDHGPREMGIFPTQAPTLVREIKPTRPDASLYQATSARLDSISALVDVEKKIREHERRGRQGHPLPWETPVETERRLRRRRVGAGAG